MKASGTGLRSISSGTVASSIFTTEPSRDGAAAKNCIVCHRSFTMKKKWERCWDEVTTCSKLCKRAQLAKVVSGSGGVSDEGNAPANIAAPLVGAEQQLSPRAARKVEKRRLKAARRADRQGKGDPDRGRKSCHMCTQRCDLLVRCRVDVSREWRMVCGSCWKAASGGVPDGDADHPEYQYGGLWKNLHATGRVANS